MTPTQSLAAIRWTYGDLADAIGRNPETVKSWLRRGTVPQHIAEWLSTLADAHSRIPCPR